MDPERARQLNRLQGELGYRFVDIDRLDRALMHSSYVHEQAEPPAASNERLEFLGDAVLELVVTEFLFQRFPEASEGQLSKARSGVVNESRLADTARRLSLGDYLLLGRGEQAQGGNEKNSLLADAMEALLAAIYLDGGLEPVRGLVHRVLSPAAERALSRAPRRDYKTRLQERVQELMHVTPRYKLVEASGPDHDRRFLVALLVAGSEVARGEGRSKKEAEQKAARQGLAAWPPSKEGQQQ